MAGQFDMINIDTYQLGPGERAVYRLPPLHFDVEVLPQRKLDGHCMYSMRIHPLQSRADDREEYSIDRESASSYGSGYSNEAYTIVRKWDDCLWFQDILEQEYAHRSRLKRRRLAQGKGVKKDGVYLNSKMASSFESLPPGPHPNSIAKELHDLLPKLNKTSSFFRVSNETLEQRQAEFQALIKVLFQKNMPSLIEELRGLRTVRDFFGYWRRDRDFEQKSDREPRPSTGTSWSLYFSPSILSLQPPISSPESAPPGPPRSFSSTKKPSFPFRKVHRSTESESSLPIFRSRKPPQSAPATYGENATFSSASDDSDVSEVVAANQQSRDSAILAFPSSPTIQEHGFEYPDTPFDPLQHRRSSASVLPTLPEDIELAMPSPELDLTDSLPLSAQRSQNVTMLKRQKRNGVLFTAPTPSSPTRDFTETSSNTTSPSSYSSASSAMSTPSTGRISILDLPARPLSGVSEYSYAESDRAESPSLLLSALMPDGEPDGEPFIQQSRPYSIASMNSVMTNSSVDRILPRAVVQSSNSSCRSSSPGSRRGQSHYSRPLSVPEEETWSGEDDDLLEAFLEAMQLSESVETRNSIEDSSRQSESQKPSSFERFQKSFPTKFLPYGSWKQPHRPTSLQVPASPSSVAMSILSDTIAVKAILTKDSILLFPVPVGITYLELRQKLYDKFVKQEGQKLSPSFSIGYVEPSFLNSASSRLSLASSTRTGSSRSSGRSRSSSASAVPETSLTFINSDEEWQEAIRYCGGKLTLRIS